jgi:hypothetical protein
VSTNALNAKVIDVGPRRWRYNIWIVVALILLFVSLSRTNAYEPEIGFAS